MVWKKCVGDEIFTQRALPPSTILPHHTLNHDTQITGHQDYSCFSSLSCCCCCPCPALSDQPATLTHTYSIQNTIITSPGEGCSSCVLYSLYTHMMRCAVLFLTLSGLGALSSSAPSCQAAVAPSSPPSPAPASLTPSSKSKTR